MDIAWQRVTEVTQRGAETVARVLVKQGEVAADRAEQAVEELLGRSEGPRRALTALLRGETDRAVALLGLARQRDLDRLQARIDELEAQPPAAPPPPPGPSAAGPAAAEPPPAAQRPRTSAAAKRAAAKARGAGDAATPSTDTTGSLG